LIGDCPDPVCEAIYLVDDDDYGCLVPAFRINNPGEERAIAPFDLQIDILTVARRSLQGSFGLLFPGRNLWIARRRRLEAVALPG
jgi:hypothetical protein